MKDYIKEGLQNRIAPAGIYKEICKALENPNLWKEERKELMRQKDKAETMALQLGSIFKFPEL